MEILIKFGANVDDEDFVGRTALHLAAGNNYLEAVKFLLYESANPFKTNREGKTPINLTTNSLIKRYLERARIVIIVNIAPYSTFIW
jgi:ankyrin repeat protein